MVGFSFLNTQFQLKMRMHNKNTKGAGTKSGRISLSERFLWVSGRIKCRETEAYYASGVLGEGGNSGVL